MKYLCMVVIDEKRLEALSPAELQALDDESLAYDQVLRDQGHLIAAQALESIRSAMTVRMQKGNTLVTDGPFAETREQVGGFLLIEATNMKEAIQLATKIPVLRLAAVEIRPIKELTSSKERSSKERSGKERERRR